MRFSFAFPQYFIIYRILFFISQVTMNSLIDIEKAIYINPINVVEILKADTHKLFANSENGDLLELAIQSFRSGTGEILGALIILGHRESGHAKITTNCTYLLRLSGEFRLLDPQLWGVFMEIEPYIAHMLLNSCTVNSWIPQDIQEFDEEYNQTKGTWKAIGMTHSEWDIRPKLERIIIQVRERFLKMMGQ